MSILQVIHHFREVIRAAQEDLPHEKEYERLAADAYVACCEWFGTPPDAKRAYFLMVSSWANTSACSYALGHYGIRLAANLDTREIRCYTMGHEMYHRVTMRRDGVRREAWVDEVMACLSGYWFLKERGHVDYASRFLEHNTRRSTLVEIEALRLLKRPRGFRFLFTQESLYPEHFYSDVTRIGVALEALVDQRSLCELPWAKSLPAWIETLPGDVAGAVSDILQVSGPNSGPPNSFELRCKYGRALRVMGRHDDSLRELTAVTQLAPENPEGYFQIAFTFKKLGRREEALVAWMRTAELNPQSFRAAYSVANLFYIMDDHPQAISWYREALSRKPDWPKALYYLGAALAYDGQVQEARQCWQKVADLADPDYFESARGSIEEWKDKGEGESKSDGLGYTRTVAEGEEAPAGQQGVTHEDNPCA